MFDNFLSQIKCNLYRTILNTCYFEILSRPLNWCTGMSKLSIINAIFSKIMKFNNSQINLGELFFFYIMENFKKTAATFFPQQIQIFKVTIVWSIKFPIRGNCKSVAIFSRVSPISTVQSSVVDLNYNLDQKLNSDL